MLNIIFPLLIFGLSLQTSAAPLFRFHLFSEPQTLRFHEQKGSGSHYLLSQISSPLFLYQNGQLEPMLAEKCDWKKKGRLLCTLKKNLTWSTGGPITASDFKRSFLRLLEPKGLTTKADLLFDIIGAENYYLGKGSASSVGIEIVNDRTIAFQLKTRNDDFLYKLAHPLLVPEPGSGFPSAEELQGRTKPWPSSGAYTITEWVSGKKIVLSSVLTFPTSAARPQVEIVFVSEDSVALALYEKEELTFLRRLPTSLIPRYQSRADYIEAPQMRLDYLGFHTRHPLVLRRSLAMALDYGEWQKLYQAKEPPGCPGLPVSLMNGRPCLTSDFTKAKQSFDEWNAARLKNQLHPLQLNLHFSKQGGDDHQRAMEWLQSQWKKNLGLQVQIRGIENKLFVEELEREPADIFRKGLAPEIPTCAATLDTFTSGHPENYIRLASPEFNDMIKDMRATPYQTQRRKLCSKALKYLIDEVLIIPTGPIYFSLLLKPGWKGLRLNELNQLDLSGLHFVQ